MVSYIILIIKGSRLVCLKVIIFMDMVKKSMMARNKKACGKMIVSKAKLEMLIKQILNMI